VSSNPWHLLEGRQLLIFDFDGTLAETTPLHAEAFRRVLAPLGVEVDYAAIAGMKTLDALRKCLDAEGRGLQPAELAALAAAKQEAVREMIRTELRPLPGVDAFLAWARPRYRLGIATSGSRGSVQLALARLGYEGWFAPVICGDDVANGKPSPEPFLRVLEITGASARTALVFEDSDAGFTAAKAAGLEYVDVRTCKWEDMMIGAARGY
jgi:HAD superfamily hydrolase (TIGR01509 family)